MNFLNDFGLGIEGITSKNIGVYSDYDRIQVRSFPRERAPCVIILFPCEYIFLNFKQKLTLLVNRPKL